jgi:3-hydroxyisobutyrate dehydrogenase-like beta-hydroxyacid dehydrogenase
VTPDLELTLILSVQVHPLLAGELDAMITKLPHCHLITSPVFGPPTAADKAQLIVVMAGDYRSKKEVAHLLIPAVGRKVYDLGGNLEKGMFCCVCVCRELLMSFIAPTFKLIGNSMILGCLEVGNSVSARTS